MATKKLSIDELKAAIAELDPADRKALLKKDRSTGPTLLSITMDCIVAHGLEAATKDIVASVTERGREAGLIAASATAKQGNVTVLKRYCAAYQEALARATPPA
jgi:hypothetical protein